LASIKIFDSPETLAEETAKNFISLTKKISAVKKNVSIALSGGNTPKLLFRILLEKYSGDAEWSKYIFYWVDERCVPPSSSESNFGEADRILFCRLKISIDKYRMKGEDDPEKEALRYGNLLKKNLPDKNGFPEFDLIMLGMGDDGHTASIFPGQLELMSSNSICAVSFNPINLQKRLTLTGKVINNAANIFFLVTGKSKSAIIGDVFKKTEKSFEFPVSYIKDDDTVIWFLDKEATSLL